MSAGDSGGDAGDRVFPSKVDGWLAALLLLLLVMGLGSLGMGVREVVVGGSGGEAVVFLGTGVGLLLLLGVLCWPVRYTLAGDRLVVRFGLLRTAIEYERIAGVSPSRNLLSAPALSLDRLRIDYRGQGGFALISPADKGEFLDALAARAPHLTREGDGLRGREES